MHWVFAYGSNMHLPDLRRWLGERGHDADGLLRFAPACVPGYELTWNYRSVVRRGGAANVIPRSGAELLGLALFVDDGLLAALDEKEGHPTRYDRGSVPVAARLRDEGAAIEVWLYQATDAHVVAGVAPPRASYLALLIEAAEEHGLAADYVERLRATPTL